MAPPAPISAPISLPAGTQAGTQPAQRPDRAARHGRLSAIRVSFSLREPPVRRRPRCLQSRLGSRQPNQEHTHSHHRRSEPSADRGCRPPAAPAAHPHLHRTGAGRARARAAGPSPRLLPRSVQRAGAGPRGCGHRDDPARRLLAATADGRCARRDLHPAGLPRPRGLPSADLRVGQGQRPLRSGAGHGARRDQLLLVDEQALPAPRQPEQDRQGPRHRGRHHLVR